MKSPGSEARRAPPTVSGGALSGAAPVFGQKAVETMLFDFGFPSGWCKHEGVSGCEQWCEQCEHVHTRVLVQLAPTKLVAVPPYSDSLVLSG